MMHRDIHDVLMLLALDSYFSFTKAADFSRLAAFTIQFVKIPPTSTDIVAIKRKFAEERTPVNLRTWGPKGRYREIQSGKSRADRHSHAEGLRNGRSGFMAALNPNERSFPPPDGSPRDCFPSRMSYLREVTSTRSAILVVPKNPRRFYSSNREGEAPFPSIPSKSCDFMTNVLSTILRNQGSKNGRGYFLMSHVNVRK